MEIRIFKLVFNTRRGVFVKDPVSNDFGKLNLAELVFAANGNQECSLSAGYSITLE